MPPHHSRRDKGQWASTCPEVGWKSRQLFNHPTVKSSLRSHLWLRLSVRGRITPTKLKFKTNRSTIVDQIWKKLKEFSMLSFSSLFGGSVVKSTVNGFWLDITCFHLKNRKILTSQRFWCKQQQKTQSPWLVTELLGLWKMRNKLVLKKRSFYKGGDFTGFTVKKRADWMFDFKRKENYLCVSFFLCACTCQCF